MVSIIMKRDDSSAGPYFFSCVFSSSLPIASVSPCKRAGLGHPERRAEVRVATLCSAVLERATLLSLFAYLEHGGLVGHKPRRSLDTPHAVLRCVLCSGSEPTLSMVVWLAMPMRSRSRSGSKPGLIALLNLARNSCEEQEREHGCGGGVRGWWWWWWWT